MRKRTYILLFFMILAVSAVAQQQPIYSQYMMNSYLLNPAIAGHKGYIDYNLTAREQWLGYGEGPSTFALSGNGRILKTSFRNRNRMIKTRHRKRRPSGRVGVGGYVFNDMNGSIRRTGLQGTYAYHIYVRNIQYSAGISLSTFQFKVDIKPEDFYTNPGLVDPYILNHIGKGRMTPDANLGFLISDENFYVGLSATSLFQSSIQFGLSSPHNTSYRLLRHYYLLAGYKFYQRGSDYGFEPSAMMTLTERGTFSLDLNGKLVYKDDYWAGLSYRTTGTVITMFGMNYQQMYFGYAYDYSWGDISAFNKWGSHEIMVGIRFGDSARRYRWLNRF